MEWLIGLLVIAVAGWQGVKYLFPPREMTQAEKDFDDMSIS